VSYKKGYKMFRLQLIFVFLILFMQCSTIEIVNMSSPPMGIPATDTHPSFLFGLIDGKPYGTSATCPQGGSASMVSMSQSFADVIVHALIGFLYHPRTNQYTCGMDSISEKKGKKEEKILPVKNDGNFNDIVVLKNGDILTGVKAAVTGDSVVVVYPNGDTKVFMKGEILSVKKK
jgi:hypothetical protein